MSNRKRSTYELKIEVAMDRAAARLDELDADSDEYAKVTDQLSKLNKLKAAEQPERVSKETLALIAANLAGISLILSYEHAHVITTKAMSFVMKPR